MLLNHRLTARPFPAIMCGFKGEPPQLTPPSLTVALPTPSDTKAAGAAFAEGLLGTFPPPALITLEGPLGAGKTTFAQGFGEAMGIPPGEVASPTFALADIHRGGVARVNHLDLYRLGGDGPPEEALREFLEAGLDECLDFGYSLVEWPERLPESYWPEDRLRVGIVMAGASPGPAHLSGAVPGPPAGGPPGRQAGPAGAPAPEDGLPFGPGTRSPARNGPHGPDEVRVRVPALPGRPIPPRGRIITFGGRFPAERLLDLMRSAGLHPLPG